MKSVKNSIAIELGKRLGRIVSEDNFDVILPVIKLPDESDRNSRVFLQFKPDFPHLTKAVSVDYDRIHVSELGVVKTAKLTAVNVHDVLGQINSDYKLELKPTDVLNEPLGLPDAQGLVTINFKFTPECLEFYSGIKVITIAEQAYGEQNKSEVKYAVIDPLRSGTEVAISNLGYDVAMRQNSVARGTMAASSGLYQFEVTILSGGAMIGFATSGALVDLLPLQKPGYDQNGWMIDTGTGMFYTNGVSSSFSRSFRFGETLAVIVDKTTGVITVKDQEGQTYSTASTDISKTTKVYPAFSSNTEFVSSIHINFGQEPFLIATDNTVKKGYYVAI